MSICHITEENLDSYLMTDYLLIDFWAKWCQPCLGFSKIIEKTSEDNADFTFASVDIEEQEKLAEEFEISSVPTVMILRKGIIIYVGTGAHTYEVLQDLLEQARHIDDGQLAEIVEEQSKM